MYKTAKEPNELEKFFVDRADARDIDGLVALYEPDAVLVSDDGQQIVGADEIRLFFANYLKGRPRLTHGVQAPALRSGDLALTSTRHSNGDISAEIARRQPDGSWLWTVDQFALGTETKDV